MLAAQITAPQTFQYLDRPIPTPGPGQVLLKNKYLGVCASDIQIYHGKHKYVTFPLVMGHEASCEIVALGEGVTDFQVGDRVIPEPQVVCRNCYPCRTGRYNVCESLKVIGVHMDGCACEYIAVDTWNLHRIPEGCPDDIAALAEPVAVGVGCISRAPKIEGMNVCVVGAGTIGNLTAQCAKAAGAAGVLITDILDEKLEIARKCGIDYCVNTKNVSLQDAIHGAFGAERAADIIIDCAATPFTFNSILTAARNSSVIIISGNFKEPVTFDVPLLQRREISLLGHMMYVREDFAKAVEYLASGKIHTDGIISAKFPLNEYDKAFAFIDAHPEQAMKVLIEINKD